MQSIKLLPKTLYTSTKIIKLYGKNGIRIFQDLLSSGRITWVQDTTEGFKLYRLNQ